MIEIRSLRDIVRLLFIFQREMRLVFWLTLCLIVAGAYLLPSRYESDARLLVKPGRDLPVEYSDSQNFGAPTINRDPIVDEEKMLLGHPVIHEVARYYLQTVKPVPPVGFWKTIKYHLKQYAVIVTDDLRSVLETLGVLEPQTTEERLETKLAKGFRVTHANGSYVMELRFIWDDPDIARLVVKKWVGSFLDERAQALRRRSLYEFYAAESKKMAQRIADVSAAVAIDLNAINGTGSQEKLTSLSDMLDKVSAERMEAWVEWKALRSSVGASKKLVGQLQPEVIKSRELGLNMDRQDLAIKLNGLELQRLDMLKVYRPGAPAIKAIDDSIAALKQRVAQQGNMVPHAETREPNQLVVALQRDRLSNEARAAELAGKVAAYDKEIADLKAERTMVLALQPALVVLEGELASDKKNYALYLGSLEKARIDRALDDSRISNIALVEQATLNEGRVFPKRPLLLLLAAPLSLAVALFAVYLSYLLDQRIHDAGNMASRFGVPVWSTVMEEEKGNLQFEASLYRLYGQIPLERVRETGLNIGLTSAHGEEGVGYIIQKFLQILQERGIPARSVAEDGVLAAPGEVVFLNAANLLRSQTAFVRLKLADMIVLVVDARHTTVPVVENALSVLNTAFGQVDGLILNRRRFEIPAKWLRRLSRVPGVN
jgi:uncharacterized protein involved in exopolysaccharide biosynthesis